MFSVEVAGKVTALVLNWCGEADTAACIRSLQASDYPVLEILLIDNGSPDGSGKCLRAMFPEISFLQTGTNLGYTGGNNRGIEIALAGGAEYVLVINNDTVVAADCVSALVRTAHADGHAGAVGPKILYFDAPDRIWFGGGDLLRQRGVGRHRLQGAPDACSTGGPEDVSFLTGCCILLRAEALREVGAFEEDFFAYVEDVDLSLRLHSSGYRLLYEPSARVLHRTPLKWTDPTPFQITQRDRNRRRLVRRRYPWADRARFHAFFYPSRIVRLFQYLLRRDVERAGAVWRGMTAP